MKRSRRSAAGTRWPPLVAIPGRRSGTIDRAQLPNAWGNWSCAPPKATSSRRRRCCWSALQSHWAALPAHAVRRLSAAPFSLFDAGFASAPRWLELRTRGVHELPQRGEPAYFRAQESRARSRVACWCTAGTSRAAGRAPPAWCSDPPSRPSNRWLPARWWRSKLPPNAMPTRCGRAGRTSSVSGERCWSRRRTGADRRLHELLLGGLQRLAAETLAAHDP